MLHLIFDGNHRVAIATRLLALEPKGHVMDTGTGKWFNLGKGFGFIAPASNDNAVFVHISALERAGIRELREGQKVSFEVVEDKRSGMRSAEKLELL